MKNYKEVRHQGILVGVDITVGDETVFIDSPINTSEAEVRDFVARLMSDTELSISDNGHVKTSEGVVLQIGRILERGIGYTSSHTQITGIISPNSRISSLKDDGTIGKSKWRFSLMQFGRKIFPKGILGEEGIVFMPGMGRDEFNLWKGFGVHSKDMTMIEGDDGKIIELQRKYRNNGSTPSYVNSYLGTGDEVFSRELVKVLNGKTVSVLSLDTESGFALGLYKDLLGVFSNIEIGEDLLLMLNVVRRGSSPFSKKFTGKFEESHDVIGDAMGRLPEQLIHDSERRDLFVRDIKTGGYLGGSATPMYFVFAHIKTR